MPILNVGIAAVAMISQSLEGQAGSPVAPVTLERLQAYAQQHQLFINVAFPLHERELIRLAKEGQTPKTLFIGCSDSRVIPEWILGAKPGELFVLRTAGNFVPMYDEKIAWDGVAATLQFAVEVVGVSDIIVCGHSQCGAIEALMSNKPLTAMPYVEHWLQFGAPAKKAVQGFLAENMAVDERNGLAERFSVIVQLQHLLSFPFVARKVAAKELYLHGWHYSIHNGEVEFYDPTTYQFTPLRKLLSTTSS